MKKMIQIIAASVLALSATVASASTIFTSNNEDVDIVVPADFNFIIAVFDDAADLNSATNAQVVDLDNLISGFFGAPDLISGEIAVGSGNSFVVGISTDSGMSWIADDGFSGGTTGIVSFTVINPSDVGVLLVDVQVAAVPVPASAWLFGSGLLGLVGIARRKIS